MNLELIVFKTQGGVDAHIDIANSKLRRLSSYWQRLIRSK